MGTRGHQGAAKVFVRAKGIFIVHHLLTVFLAMICKVSKCYVLAHHFLA